MKFFSAYIAAMALMPYGGVNGDNQGNPDGYDEVNRTVWPEALVGRLDRSTPSFGESVAISGDILVVGSPRETAYDTDGREIDRGGVVRVYNLTTGAQLHDLSVRVPMLVDGDEFGRSVTISGDLFVVGSDFSYNEGNGSAYIYNSASGVAISELRADDGASRDNFGFQVAASENYIVVAETGKGDFYVYNATTKAQLHKLPTVNITDIDIAEWVYGGYLAISGDTIVVGMEYDDINGTQSGSAFVFNAATGEQLHRLVPTDAAADRRFGNSVAISGDYIVIGAFFYDDETGKAYVFDKNTGEQLHELEGSNKVLKGGYFGNSVAISGDIIAVGAPDSNVEDHDDGVVHLFNATTGEILQEIFNPQDDEITSFGKTVCIDGNILVVGGAGNEVDEVGAVLVFDVTKDFEKSPTPAPSSLGGAGSDPIILGLNNQVFKFEGRSEGWYANIANPFLFWNMQFRRFDTCPLDENMFITGMSLSTFGDNHAEILIVTTPESIEECRINPDAVCLGEGTLHVSFDGGNTFVSQPGDYHFGSLGRIVAHNTYAACSRKWHDYDVSEQQGRNLREGGRRMSVTEKKPLALLSDKKMTMIDAEECGAWIEDRVQNNDLFQQKGHWSTLYIETDAASFHVEYRRSDWFNRRCDFQSLDAWITKVDGKMEKLEWNGILGETKKKIYDATTGEQVLSDRMKLLRGKDDADYEVDGPFGTIFAAGGGAGLGAIATTTS